MRGHIGSQGQEWESILNLRGRSIGNQLWWLFLHFPGSTFTISPQSQTQKQRFPLINVLWALPSQLCLYLSNIYPQCFFAISSSICSFRSVDWTNEDLTMKSSTIYNLLTQSNWWSWFLIPHISCSHNFPYLLYQWTHDSHLLLRFLFH